MKKKKEFQFMNNSLDVIRLFAACQVAVLHYLNLNLLYYRQDGFEDTIMMGLKRLLVPFPGVVILFTISGFLMGASMVKSESTKTFFKKRFLRIYPALWVNILLTALVIIFVLQPEASGMKALLAWLVIQGAGMAYTPNFLSNFGAGSINGALWTVMVEVQLYLFVYLAGPLLRKFRRSEWNLILSAAFLVNLLCWLVREKALLPGSVLSLLDRTLIPYLIWFLIGLYLFRFKEEMGGKLMEITPYLGVGYIGYCICRQIFSWTLPGYYVDFVTTLTLPFLVIGAAYLMGKHRIKADLSYGIFLYHWPVINLIFHWGLPDKVNHLLLLITYIAIFFALSMFSWIAVEGRSIRKKSRSTAEM